MDEKKSGASGEERERMEQTPWSVSPDTQSVESLVFTHEGVRRMDRALDEPSPLWRLGFSLVSAAAVFALVFTLVRLVSDFPPPSGSEPLADAPPVLTNYDSREGSGTPDPFSIGTLADTSDAGEGAVMARPLPREPFKEQKRPPCTRFAEVELLGACWTPHELKAPCPDVLYEYQGKCYVPAVSAKPPPQSVGQ